MSEKIQRFWNNSSKSYRYDQWEKTAVAQFDYTLTKNALLRFLEPKKSDTVMEIGCGPGKWTNIISKKTGKIIAVDISKDMLDEAKKYCKSRNIKFVHGDIMDIDICEKFDKIYAVRSIEYIKNKLGLLRKTSSLLKSGGKLVIITKTRPCLWDMTKKVKNFWQEKISYKQLVKICERVGFVNIVVKPVIIRLPIFVNGNREFPIIGKRHEMRVLAFFKKFTENAQNTGGNPFDIMMKLSECYILYAEKM